MPFWIMALAGSLIQIAGTVAGRVMLSLGFGVVAYTGVSASLTFLKTQAVTALTSLPPAVVGMLSQMKVGECVSIIFSALLVRLALNGLTSDTIKRLVQR